VLIVEMAAEDQPFPTAAEIYPAGVDTDDLQEALAWAEMFNERELQEPISAWAVVRRNPGVAIPASPDARSEADDLGMMLPQGSLPSTAALMLPQEGGAE
jgi:hypothetical protein